MAKTEKTGSKGSTSKSALVFEMDSVGLGARQIRFETLTGILGEQGIAFDAVLFSRYCLHSNPMVYMPGLLKQMNYTAATPEQVVDRLVSETISRLMQKSTKIQDGLVKWLDVAAARGMAIGCATMLPQQSADTIAQNLDFARWDIRVSSVQDASDKIFPRADHWIRMARALECSPKNCLAIVSSMGTAKSSLAAAMNVVAVPDAFTEHQDFSGANAICSNLKELKPETVFEQLGF